MTKEEAIEVFRRVVRNDSPPTDTAGANYRDGAERLLEALDAAGAFADADALAEIESAAREVLRADSQAERNVYARADIKARSWGWALRLATACRKAGMVKPCGRKGGRDG